MGIHAVLCHGALMFSALCLSRPPAYVHAPFCIFVLAVAIYNGAKRYSYMLTESDAKKIRKIIQEHYPNLVPETKKEK